jgi:hypothetical protein
MRAVSDEMVLTLSATGTADDVAAQINALLEAGLKQAVLFPLAADGDARGAILQNDRGAVMTAGAALGNPVWSALTGPYANLTLVGERRVAILASVAHPPTSSMVSAAPAFRHLAKARSREGIVLIRFSPNEG